MTPEELLAEAREVRMQLGAIGNTMESHRALLLIHRLIPLLEREAAAAKEWRCPLEYCEVKGPHGHSGMAEKSDSAFRAEQLQPTGYQFEAPKPNDLTQRQHTLALAAASLWATSLPGIDFEARMQWVCDTANDILKEVERRAQ